MLPANLFANVLPLGIDSVITLYVLNSPFCLPSIQVGYFKGIQFTVLGIGAAIGIKLLRSCFPPHIISMFGILSYAAFYTTLSFARTVTMLYVGELIRMKHLGCRPAAMEWHGVANATPRQQYAGSLPPLEIFLHLLVALSM